MSGTSCLTNICCKNFLANVVPVYGLCYHEDLCCISDVSENNLTFSIFEVAAGGNFSDMWTCTLESKLENNVIYRPCLIVTNILKIFHALNTVH